jgi:aspartate racemase
MKTIGLVGGTSWISTVDYYRIINQYMNERLGGLHAARMVLYSVNYGEVDAVISQGTLEDAWPVIQPAARAVKQAGAECILLCANTMHRFAQQVREETGLPLIHIGEVTAIEVRKKGLKKVGLLGTRYTMEMDFYHEKFQEQGIVSLVPDKKNRDYIHDAIFHELLNEKFLPETKKRFLEIMDDLALKGAEGIILGCTEIPLLINQKDTTLPLFNTTEIHARAAVDYALG